MKHKEKLELSEVKKRFFNILKDDSCGIFPAPTNAQLGITILCEYLLGEDWYTANPVNGEQGNTEIVDSILWRYSRQYRKDVKKARKQLKRR